jgi:ComF family protein
MARCGVYDKALRDMILAFKNGKTEMDVVFSLLANSAFAASPFFEKIELLTPVPLHWSRRLRRGYNQSLVVAHRLRHPRAKVCRAVARVRRTAAQPSMPSPQGRARNVAGAFGVRNPSRVAGRSICLVDDVKTTGATLNECARVLKQAGAAKVFALVLAVAGQARG